MSWSFVAGLAVAAGLLAAFPGTGLSQTAAHDPWKVEEVRGGTPIGSAYGRCEACHTMNTTEGEPGTSYISSTARTIQWIKSYKTPAGPFVPADMLACTFCHYQMLGNLIMEDALAEFTTPTIKHPVGRKIVSALGTDTNNEWLSKFDSAPLADELQCTSCHTTALLTYPYHQGSTTDPAPWTGSWNKTINPKALQNVSVAGDGDKAHCVSTCHGNAVAGGNSPTKPLMGHYVRGSFNGTTLYDPTGQALSVAGSVCVTCHDTHSSTKPGLIQDGLKRGAADPGRTAINENNCVAVCHASGAFNTHGHGGKTGISSTACTPCHVSSIRHRDPTDTATRRRLGYSDPVLGDLAQNKSADGLDNDMDGVKDASDPDEGTFRYSKTSNCKTCHINYAGHGTGARVASCLDCHDMHGDDAAVNNNAVMIRSTLFGEPTVYTAADRAAGVYFRTATPNGVCDNDACHSNISGNLSATHLGGPINDSTNCAGCHTLGPHPRPVTPSEESFKVVMNCSGCHSYPPVAADTVQDGLVRIVDHTLRRRGASPSASTDAQFLTAHNGCTLCHGISGNGTLDGFANAEPGGGGKDAYTGHRNGSVNLNGISAPDNNQNANYTISNGQCARACHSADWVVGYTSAQSTIYATGNVVWLQEYGSGACNSCHGGGNNTVNRANYWPDGQSAAALRNEDRESSALRHEKHMEKLAAAQFGETIAVLLTTTGNGTTDAKQKKLCAYCHPDPFNGSFDPGGATSSFDDNHNTGTVNVGGIYGHRQWDTYAAPFATTDGWTYTAGSPATSWDGSCASVDCHDNKTTSTITAGATTGYGWYDVTTTACVMCHDDITVTTAGTTGQTHQAHVAAGMTTRAAGGAVSCSSCHPGTPAWGSPGTAPGSPAGTGHINGTFNPAGGTVTYTYGGTYPTIFGSCGINTCHNNGQLGTNAQNPYNWGTEYGGGTNTCVECHAASPATQAHTAHLSGAFGRAIVCDDCHTAATANTHANGTVNFGGVTFTYGVAADAVVAVNGGTFASCGTNNCHRADLANTTPLTVSYPWNSAALPNCSICHGDTAATLTSNAHDPHLASNALPGTDVNECYACHNAVATSTGTLIAAGGHLDFNLTGDVTFPALYDYEAVGGTGIAGTSPAITCSDIRCHNGETTPAWNLAAGTILCGDCHGTSGPLPIAASIAGSHAAHANNDNDYADCQTCHANATSFLPTGGHLNHQNLAINLTITAANYADNSAVPGDAGGINWLVAGTNHVDNGTCTYTLATGCHPNGATPVWGATGTVACTACHGTPPTLAAVPNRNFTHGSHYTAKGWANNTANCTACHPDNTVFHALVNGVTTVNSGLSPAGASPAITCSVQTVGCHNGDAGAGIAAPAWNSTPGTILCTSCHTVNGTNTATRANPVSGLHYLTAANKTAHDDVFGSGYGCTSCHTKTSIGGHWNGTASATADYSGAQVGIIASTATYVDAGGTGATRGTCSGTGTTVGTCHSDGGNWARQWSTNANTDHVATFDPGNAVCDVCHGQYGSWRGGTSHFGTYHATSGELSTRGNTHNRIGGVNNSCEDCHAYPSLRAANHNSAVHRININNPGTGITETGAPDYRAYCTNSCHTNDGAPTTNGTHTFTQSDFTLLTVDGASDPEGNCTGCHGNDVSKNAWPDSLDNNPTRVAEADDDGAHSAHAAAGLINGMCDYCHPSNSHSGDGTVPAELSTTGFRNMAGLPDADAVWNGTNCTNVNCHNNQPTPGWYGTVDAVAPVFSPNNIITVTNPGTDGDLQISWPTATDATSPPVVYDLYRINNATTGDACLTGTVIASNLGTTSYFDTGLTNGTNYRYCAKAKDNVAPTPNTANTTSNHAAPSAPASGSVVYRFLKDNVTVYDGTNSTNLGTTCGTAPTGIAVITGPLTAAAPSPSRGLLSTAAYTCGAGSDNNYASATSGGSTTVYRYLASFYTAPYATPTTVTGQAAGNVLRLYQGATVGDDYQVYFAAVSPTGVHTLSSAFTQTNYVGTINTWATVAPNLSALTVNVPAGSRFAILVQLKGGGTTGYRVAFDNQATAGADPQITVTEAPTADTTPPAFPGNNSGITAVDAATGGAATVTWVAATDAHPSNPVRYTVYGVQSAAQPASGTLFQAGNIKQSGILALTTTVTGLATGNPWWFGVRATDAANNVETANTTISTPGVTPTGGGGGTTCATCHTWPQTSGAHAAHAATGTSPDTDATTCVKCHGNTVLYTTGHGNGVLNFTFTGDVGGAASYSSTTPGVVNGTCSNVDCHYETLTQAWNITTNLTCTSCHSASLPDAHTAHTTSRSLPQTGQNDCFACHNTVVNNAGAILTQTWGPNTSALHPNTTRNVSLNATYASTLTPSGSGTATTCSTVTCHNTKVTPLWGTTGIACTSCHAAGGAAAADPTSGLHARTNLLDHDDAFNAAPVYTCTSCHLSTDPSTAHNDLTLQNAGATTYNWTATYAIAYNRAADTCTALCHSDNNGVAGTWNRKWTNAVDAVVQYTDDAATATVCRNCHGSFFTGWNIVGATDHVNPDPDNNAGATPALADSRASHSECTKCHGWGHATYTGGGMHNSAVHQLQMNSDLGYQDGGGTAGQCTTNCHAGLTLSMDTNSGWTTVLGAFGGVGCGDCHNGGTRPGAANNSGAHDAHGATDAALVAPGTACIPCHGNNGGSNYANTPAGTHGIGNAVNWATNMVYSTAVRNNTTGTCSGTAACHVASGTGAVNIQWGQTQVGTNNCLVCHQGAGDVNNYAWEGTATGISRVNNTEYTAVGHGSPTQGNGTGCMACHDITVPHDTTAALTGTNPFRLVDQDLGTAGLQFSCSFNNASCHLAATPTNEVALNLTYGAIQNHERANFPAPQVDTWSYTPKCVDCHDPHGDVGNAKMIHNDLWDNGSSATMVPTNYASRDDANVTFNNYTTGQQATPGAYAVSGATPTGGLCQECHELNGGAVADPDMTSYLDNWRRGASATGTADSTNHPAAPGDCSGCHKHDSGFKPSGCNGCHGGDYASGGWTSNNFWPSLASGSYPYRGGKHLIHINQLMLKLNYTAATITDQQQKTMCDYCHDNPSGDPGAGGHDDYVAPANVGAFNPIWSTLTANYPSTADVGVAATYTPGNGVNGTCAGIDCHNDKSTTTTFDWYDTPATSICTMCHTPGGSTANNPFSGLHTGTPTISTVAHDDAFAGIASNACVTCHNLVPAMSPTSAHINGAVATNDAVPTNEYYTMPAYTDAAQNSGTCSGTGAPPAGVNTGCHTGGDGGTWARKWSTDAYLNTGNATIAASECGVCHGTFASGWTFGLTSSVGDGSVEHGRNWDGDANLTEVATSHVTCQMCHNYGDSSYVFGTHHRNGSITMNSDPTVNYNIAGGTAGDFGCDGGLCHANDWSGSYPTGTGHRMEVSSWPTNLVDGPAAACDSCHGPSGPGPTVVYPTGTGAHTGANTPYGSHLKAANADVLTTTTDWGVQCGKCHGTGHADGTQGANDVEIPTRYGAGNTQVPTMNQLYATHNYAIKLGGTATLATATSEAQICWSCHYTNLNAAGNFAEMGVNNNAATGSMVYSYGTLSTWNATDFGGWYNAAGATPATWYSAQRSAPSFSYKDGAVQSMHGANFSATGPGNDPRASIRCSYCHDVHDTLPPAGAETASQVNGNPYLRGAWKGNPFPEDGAPQVGQSFPNITTGTQAIGPFPRVNTASRSSDASKLGGYFINQNTALAGNTVNVPVSNTNAGGLNGDVSINNWASLCEKCHYTNANPTVAGSNASWSAAEIDGLNYSGYTGGQTNTWSGSLTNSGYTVPKWAGASANGHANSVLGGTGSSSPLASDIYNERIRMSGTYKAGGNNGVGASIPAAAYMNFGTTAVRVYGFRTHSSISGGWSFAPRFSDATVGQTNTRVSAYMYWNWKSTTPEALWATVGNAGANPDATNNKYHQFPCSKCHMPHVSRLPRLLVTNCLDVNHVRWAPTGWVTPASAGTNVAGESVSSYNLNKLWPQTTAAVNCHRRADTTRNTTPAPMQGKGWNTVSPWP